MISPDHLTLLNAMDLVNRRIVPSKKTLFEWMKRKVDPFPKPIVLSPGKKQAGRQRRYSGRKVAWRATDVEKWLLRRERAGARKKG